MGRWGVGGWGWVGSVGCLVSSRIKWSRMQALAADAKRTKPEQQNPDRSFCLLAVALSFAPSAERKKPGAAIPSSCGLVFDRRSSSSLESAIPGAAFALAGLRFVSLQSPVPISLLSSFVHIVKYLGRSIESDPSYREEFWVTVFFLASPCFSFHSCRNGLLACFRWGPCGRAR